MSYQPLPLPKHLPEHLTICLWDFSWYTQVGPGQPYENLDKAFAELVSRGFNTIRICAMPFLLFGSRLDTSAASFGPLGGEYGQRVRWYNVAHRTTLDAKAHLLELFRAAKRHNVYVILSSWEYQQSSSFYGDRSWFDALMAVDPEQRLIKLANAQADLYEFLAEHDLADRVAFVELHNEVQFGFLTDGLPDDGADHILALKDRLTAGLDTFHKRLPNVPVTVNYAGVPAGAMRGIPENIDVAVFHPYVYGVLDEITADLALRDEPNFSTAKVRHILRPGAPEYADWQPPKADLWRKDATIVGKPEIYVHDWSDAEAFDRVLYEKFQNHHQAMLTKLNLWMDVASDFAKSRGIPLLFGEGWVGYTPLDSWYEEGPIGAEFCRIAARKSKDIDAKGYIVCSNAAPHHPMWQLTDLITECNRIFADA